MLAQSEQTNFLRLERIDLASFVEELWDGVRLTAQRRFELGRVPPGVLTADPDRLAQALRNLARNAIEHTEAPDGLVRLSLERVPPDRIRLLVDDDGTGIPPGQRERVFERFHRTDPARTRAAGGAGLGLAIVRAIANAHSGRVRAGAVPGARGARLELQLPGFKPGAPPRALGRAGERRPVGAEAKLNVQRPGAAPSAPGHPFPAAIVSGHDVRKAKQNDRDRTRRTRNRLERHDEPG